MVVIVDPHLKRDDNYPAFKQASELGILVKPKSGEGEYEGWCWPGSSSWTDFFNPAAWDWWKSMFKIEAGDKWSWTKSTTDIHIWNDMNEVEYFLFHPIFLLTVYCSPLFSTALKSACRGITFTMAAGSIAMSTTLMACST